MNTEVGTGGPPLLKVHTVYVIGIHLAEPGSARLHLTSGSNYLKFEI